MAIVPAPAASRVSVCCVPEGSVYVTMAPGVPWTSIVMPMPSQIGVSEVVIWAVITFSVTVAPFESDCEQITVLSEPTILPSTNV
ncbi:hypothetical protein D9M68_256960 [compost metagenome]